MPGKRQNRRHCKKWNFAPPTEYGIFGTILNIFELNQMIHLQLVNKTMILQLTYIIIKLLFISVIIKMCSKITF